MKIMEAARNWRGFKLLIFVSSPRGVLTALFVV
jgi:hypothetical protein